MDKIYSRFRIRIRKKKGYNNKHNNSFGDIKKVKYKKIKLVILFLVLCLVLFFIFFIKTIIPVFKANCLSKANSLGIKIVNEEVRKVMAQYSYDDLIITHTDINGNINFLESNIISINEIISKIISNIQSEIDKNESSKVYINMGTISGISALKNVGPSVGITLETGGNVKAKINTEFSESGINQTLHRVYIDVETTVKIVTPIAVYSKMLESRVLIAEAIIVGNIPDTYYNLDGVSENDVMEVME